MGKGKEYYIVMNWIGRILGEFDSLGEADDYKYSLSDDEDFLSDIYVFGIDKHGNEFAPNW